MNNKIVVILLLLITAGIAYATDDWNLAGTSTFTGVNTSNLNLTYLTQNSIPFIGVGGQVTQDVANLSYFTTNGTLVVTNISAKKIGGIIYANQYATLQDALNASNDVGGGIVQLSNGIYNQTNIPIKIYNNTILRGAGNNTIIRLANAVYVGGTETRFITNSCSQPTPTCSNFNIVIEDLQIDANKQGQTGLQPNDLYGIVMHWANNIKISNVRVVNAHSSGIGIWPISNPTNLFPSDAVLTGIIAENNGGAQELDAGIFISDGTGRPVRVSVSDSIVQNNLNGLVVEDSKGSVTINNVHAYNNTHYGFGVQSAQNVQFNNIFAKWNGYSGFGSTGIVGERFISIQGSFEENGRYGIEVRGANYNIINSIIKWNNYSGIYIDGYNTNVVGNQILGNGVNTSAPNRAGVYIMNNIYGNNRLIGNIIGEDQAVYKVSGSQQYGIQEGEAISGGTTHYNIYAYNNIDAWGVAATSLNTSSQTRVSINNARSSPFNFGNSATAPTAFGAGDTYFNSTKTSMCVYTTSWVFIGNSTGVC